MGDNIFTEEMITAAALTEAKQYENLLTGFIQAKLMEKQSKALIDTLYDDALTAAAQLGKEKFSMYGLQINYVQGKRQSILETDTNDELNALLAKLETYDKEYEVKRIALEKEYKPLLTQLEKAVEERRIQLLSENKAEVLMGAPSLRVTFKK